MPNPRPIIDAHLDLAWNALSYGRDLTRPIAEINAAEADLADAPCRSHVTVSLPALRDAGVRLCGATLFVRHRPDARHPAGFSRLDPDYPTADIAHAIARGQLAYYHLLAELGHLRIITDADALDDHWRHPADKLGIIIAMEGADPIVDPSHVDAWCDLGLRIVNLVHNGRNRYATGLSTPDAADHPPITSDGLALLDALARRGVILDLTHLADPALGIALDRYPGPIIASHHNCRALVPHPRQLTDEHIRRITQRNGVIGIALDNWMLAPNWSTATSNRADVPLDVVADHIDHICQLAGDCRHVGIGSDLDGGFGNEETPHTLDTIADLPRLAPILEKRGYSPADLDAVFHNNFLTFFRTHLQQPEDQRRN